MKAIDETTSYQMRILSAIGICFVLLGHITNSLTSPGTFYGWFPYYSCHMPLFLFISGYFFRDLPKEHFRKALGRFVLKKFKNLMLPYYVINGGFILIGMFLATRGFTSVRLYTFPEYLLCPWTTLQPVTWAVPTWFLAGLFISEIYFVLLRSLADRVFHREGIRELFLMLLVTVLSIGAVWLKQKGFTSEAGDVYLRSVLILFFLEMGVIYRKFGESRDTLPHIWYFLILFFLQFLMIVLTRNSFLSPGLYNLSNLGRMGIVYMAAGITGILLWLRIAKIIASVPHRSKLLLFIGSNTKYIMSFHLFGYFLLNTLFCFLVEHHIGTGFLSGFDKQQYLSHVYYVCLNNPRLLVLYFLAGMVFSLLLSKLILLCKTALRKVRAKHRSA